METEPQRELLVQSGTKRFLKYSAVGISTFAIDLALLFLLTDVFDIHYVLSAGIAFILAISLNYALARTFVFKGTLRSVGSGYAIFLIIALSGLILVTSLMYVFVDTLALNYIASRVIIAGAVGVWTYLMNLYVNFKVAGI